MIGPLAKGRALATRDACILYFMADLTSLLGGPVGSSSAKGPNHEVHVKDYEWAGRLRVAESFNEHMPSTWAVSYTHL